jgi:hypothetical protein
VTFTLSPPVRYAALLGLLAAVLIGGGMTFLGHRGTTTSTPHVINKHPFGTNAKHASTTPKATTKPKGSHTTTKPTPAPVVPKAPERPAAVLAALNAGLPPAIASALGQHSVVVVSLYNPYSQVDGIAFAEARAGAQLANVGFVPLNVLSQAQAEKLTETLGLLPNPGLLVYVRPATLAVKISGFADKETVAQAAHNAAVAAP